MAITAQPHASLQPRTNALLSSVSVKAMSPTSPPSRPQDESRGRQYPSLNRPRSHPVQINARSPNRSTCRWARPSVAPYGLSEQPLGNEFKVRDEKTGLLDRGAIIKVDHARNTESVGARAWLAETEYSVRSALREARKEDCPCVFIVPTKKYRYTPDSRVWWEVVGADVTQDPRRAQLVAEREFGRTEQRLYH